MEEKFYIAVLCGAIKIIELRVLICMNYTIKANGASERMPLARRPQCIA